MTRLLPTVVVPRDPEVLLISPPMMPPWRNGSVLIARDLALGGQQFRYRVLGKRGQAPLSDRTRVEAFYRDAKGSNLLSRIRLLARLCRRDRTALHHFFFAPHPTVSTAARAALAFSQKPSVHTVPSQPRLTDNLRRLMFADHVVAVSEATSLLLRSAGVDNVRVIRPGVALPPERDQAEYRRRYGSDADWREDPVFLYAGDLEFSNGAATFVEAAILSSAALPNARFLLACRPKTPRSGAVLDTLRRRVRRLGLAQRIQFLGVVDKMHDLLGAVTAVVMPVDTLYAKVDMPYVLLEAMARSTPIIVSDLPALTELAGLGSGALVTPRSDPEKVADRMLELAQKPKRTVWLGSWARKTIATAFDPNTMVDAYEQLYVEALGG